MIFPGALSLAACVAGPSPKVETPPPVLPESFTYASDPSAATSLEALLPRDDPAFATLMAKALVNSPRLGEAFARVEQARAGAERARGAQLPEIGANSAITATRTNPAQFSAALPQGVAIDAERISYGANLTARWDPDIFGRLRAEKRAALARLDAADASARAVCIALVAEIASSLIDWRTVERRHVELSEDLAAAESLARLSEVREKAGITPGFDRVRAQAAVSAARSRIEALDSERARHLGRLVTLTAQDGSTVRAALALPAPSSALPTAPPSLPSNLLVNRPDLLAAAATLASEDAELAAAARRRFPVFDLSATMGLLAYGFGNLFDSQSLVGSFAASLASPLIDFGRIQAEIDGAAAEKKAAFEAYRGTVYTALGDAEASYGLVAAADREALVAQQELQELSRAEQLANTRYEAGIAAFLTVLEARRNADASGERLAAAHGQARRARLLLWQALGGDAVPCSKSN